MPGSLTSDAGFRKVYGAFETLSDLQQQKRLLWELGNKDFSFSEAEAAGYAAQPGEDDDVSPTFARRGCPPPPGRIDTGTAPGGGTPGGRKWWCIGGGGSGIIIIIPPIPPPPGG